MEYGCVLVKMVWSELPFIARLYARDVVSRAARNRARSGALICIRYEPIYCWMCPLHGTFLLGRAQTQTRVPHPGWVGGIPLIENNFQLFKFL